MADKADEILDLFRQPFADLERQLKTVTTQLGTFGRDLQRTSRALATIQGTRQLTSTTTSGGQGGLVRSPEFGTLVTAITANTAASISTRQAIDRLVAATSRLSVFSGVSAAASVSAAQQTARAANSPQLTRRANPVAAPVPALPLESIEPPEAKVPPKQRTAREKLNASLNASRAAATRNQNQNAIPVLELAPEETPVPIATPVATPTPTAPAFPTPMEVRTPSLPLRRDNELPLEFINEPGTEAVPTPTQPTPIPTPTQPTPIPTKKPHVEKPQKPGESDEDYRRRIERNRRERAKTKEKQEKLRQEAEKEERHEELSTLLPEEMTPQEAVELEKTRPQPVATPTPTTTAPAKNPVPIATPATATPIPVTAPTTPPTGGAGGGGGRTGAGLIGGGPGGGGGGGNWNAFGALIGALNRNTDATNRNTAAMRGGIGGRGLPPGNNPPNEPPTRRRDSGFENATTSGFIGGAAGILGLVGLSDPSAMSTFTGSLKILSGELGEVFIPYVISAAHGLQDLANWFRDLDGTTKTWIGRAGVAAVATLGVGMVLSKVIGIVGTLSGAVVHLGRTLTFGLVTNPILAGIVGLTAAVGALGAAWYATGSSAKDATNAMQQGARVAVQANQKPNFEPVEPHQVEKLLPPEVFKRFSNAPKLEDRSAVLNQFIDQQKEQLTRLQNQQAQAIAANPEAMAKWRQILEEGSAEYRRAAQEWRRSPDYKTIPRGREQAAEDQFMSSWHEIILQRGIKAGVANEDDRNAESRRDVFAAMNPKVDPRTGKQIPFEILPRNVNTGLGVQINKLLIDIEKLGSIRERLGLEKDAHLNDWKSPVKARYTDAVSYRESVQLAALNVPETEAEAVRRQMQRLEERMGENGPLIQAINNQTMALQRALKQIQPMQD